MYFEYPRFEWVEPPELRGAAIRHTVAIVGAGPVGLTAALDLARHGVRAVVVDDKDSVSVGSRAICISRHSLEGLQQLGLAERFTAHALGWTHGTSFYRSDPVFRLEMPHSPHERYLPMYNLQQPFIELYLAQAAQAEPLLEMRWQSRVTSARQAGDCAVLAIDGPGGCYELNACYVIAADGARSTLRQALGLTLQGDNHVGRYVIVDIRLRSAYPTERRAYFDCPANPGATVLVHRQPHDIWRIDYQLQADEDAASAVAEPAIRARVAAILDMLGEREPWTLEWWSLYQAHTLCLDDYRAGRVFFAGDSAHLVPIFGVRGLNSGFADALNLSWKLAAVLAGAAPERLLDSYSPERRGATLDIFEQAGRSTRFMAPPTAGFRKLRDATLGLARDGHVFAQRLLDPRQSQPYTYAVSPLTTPDSDVWRGGPAPGAPLANRRLADGSFLLDELGVGYTGLYFSRTGISASDLATLPRIGGLAGTPLRLLVIGERSEHADDLWYLCDPDGEIAAAHDAVDGSFYLVRPDRHVCARRKRYDPDAIMRAWATSLGHAQGLT